MHQVTATSLSAVRCARSRRLSGGGRHPYDALRPWSAITHGLGAVLSALGAIFLLLRAPTPLHMASFAIYGLSMVALYTASTLYHCLRTCVAWRRRLRKLDHCTICLLIAGSYTPICILALKDSCGPALLTAVWLFAAVGILQSLLWITAPRWLSAGVYLCMGWLVIFALKPLCTALPAEGLFWLVTGGVLYSIGGILYALRWPGRNNPHFGFHEIFHVFILLGSVCHYINMYRVVLHL